MLTRQARALAAPAVARGARVLRPRNPADARGWLALTGTPGTGKSTVARALAPLGPVLEVSELAARSRSGRVRRISVVEVDLPRVALAFRSLRRTARGGVVVGHLAHFLPIRDVVVLRCHPLVLARRLKKAGRSRLAQLRNAAAEATDLILIESRSPGHRVWEVDTTGRTSRSVAQEILGLARLRPPARYGRVNWLADPRVTAELLRSTR